MSENHAIYINPIPKNKLLNGIDYYTYLMQYVNNTNVKFKLNLKSVNSEVEIDFTTDILIKLIREEITGELGLYQFNPSADTGFPFVILNGVINGEDVFHLISHGWAYQREEELNRKKIYFDDMHIDITVLGGKVKISDKDKRRYLLGDWDYGNEEDMSNFRVMD